MESVKHYGRYKDTQIEWLEKIPNHWEIVRLKNVGNAIIGLTYSPDDVSDDGILVFRSTNIQNGKISYTNNVYVNKKIKNRLITQVGDILICSRNGSRNLIGKCAFLTEEDRGNSFGAFTTVFRSEYNKFLFYVFNSSLFEFQSGSFLTSTINQLTVGNLYNFKVPFPSHQEQQKIAAFLDRETAKLDKLVEKKERLIELLKEKRQAMISQAVTKGLDPAVPMKDSGIEWLGEVPKHWNITPLKLVSRIVTGGTPRKSHPENYSDGTIPWIKPDSLGTLIPIKSSKEYLSKKGASLIELIPRNSVLVGCIGNVGKLGISGVDLCTNQQINSIIFNPILINVRYGIYTSIASQPEYERIANKVVVSIVNKTQHGNIKIPLPPLNEQKKVADWLDQTTNNIDQLVNKLKRQIILIKEYRQALISAAVTGKINVRNEVQLNERGESDGSRKDGESVGSSH